MTLAAALNSTQQTVPHSVPVVILGTDALLAAAPATPVQLAHACMRAGYANAIPASWGDELIAATVLRRLSEAGAGPAIQCSCPIVAHRLLSAGGDLRPVLLALVSPPVAIARYVRALSQPHPTRVTYVGSCPGALDESIDIRMSPAAFIALLAERDILIDEQPRVFESIIPPDRRRYRSLPGGVPSAEVLWNELGSRALVEVEGEDFIAEIAQHLLTGKNALIDASVRLGCACSGAVSAATPAEARAAVVAMEPPRATAPVVEERAPIDLDLPLPAAPRTPIDVVAAPPEFAEDSPPPSPQTIVDVPLGNRISPVRGGPPITESRPTRGTSAIGRPVVANPPAARGTEGKTLPRTYVARRRSSPKGIPAVSIPDDPPAPARKAPSVAATPVAIAARDDPSDQPRQRTVLDAPLTLRQILLILIATIAIAVAVSTIVTVTIGRSLSRSADVTSAH